MKELAVIPATTPTTSISPASDTSITPAADGPVALAANAPAAPSLEPTQAQVDAAILRRLAIPGHLSVILGSELVGTAGVKLYMEQFVRDAGSPSDPIEAVLLQQVVLAHHRVAQLHSQAAVATKPETVRVLNAAAIRLLGELRRLALALRQYRLPPASRSFSVVHQQNVVGSGQQQVQYVDRSTGGPGVSISVGSRSELTDNPAGEHGDAHGVGTEVAHCRQSPTCRCRSHQRLPAAAVE